MIDRRSLLAAAPALAAAPRRLLAQSSEPGAREIIARAHEVAGGETWARPRSLVLTGRGVFYPKGTHAGAVAIPDYRMWRVFPTASTQAHAANGMVRIDARRPDGSVYFQIAYDGERTYNQDGVVPGAEASREWSENFGFGIIRFALQPGYTLTRLPDVADMHVVRVVDPSGGATLFGIGREDSQIRWLGFKTPRGWHERRYSRFYRNPGVSFTQPGHVALLYDGVLQNAIDWTSYRLNEVIPRDLFQLA